MSLNDHRLYPDPVYIEPPAKLTVSDIERLVKAGVTVTFADIAAQVTPDYMPAPENIPVPDPKTLEDAFWQRWKRAHTRVDPMTFEGMMRPYKIHCHERGSKVFVMVCSDKEDPFLIEDEAALYPSDALMAKLAIYEKVKP